MNGKIMLLGLLLVGAACGKSRKLRETGVQAADEVSIRPAVQVLAAALEPENEVTGPYVGEGNSPAPQWPRYEQLAKAATEPELVALTADSHAVVRCYAFMALVERNSAACFPVLRQHLRDATKVDVQYGCLVMKQFVGDYFLELATAERRDSASFHLKAEQQAVVDSVLRSDKHIELFARYKAISSLTPTPANYSQIRRLVAGQRSLPALGLLAHYQKPADKRLIASFFAPAKDPLDIATVLFAVREYPDMYFYPFVKAAAIKEWGRAQCDFTVWEPALQILARFPNPEVRQLFEQIVRIEDEERRSCIGTYLLVAITKYPHPVWEPLKARIRLDKYARWEVERMLASK